LLGLGILGCVQISLLGEILNLNNIGKVEKRAAEDRVGGGSCKIREVCHLLAQLLDSALQLCDLLAMAFAQLLRMKL
jgi:hypothetical protein